MTDIAEKLRKHPTRLGTFRPLLDDAADEIERLRKELSAARTEPENLRDDDRFNKGVLHAQDILNKLIGDPEYVASDGSEDYDTDLGDTILNQLAAAGLYDKEECRFATLAVPQS